MTLGLAVVLFGLAVVVTAGTRWLVSRAHRASAPRPVSALDVASDLIWMVLVWAGGLLAARYIERIQNAAAGYAAFVVAALMLSLVRAWLYYPLAGVRQAEPTQRSELWRETIHAATVLALAAAIYLALSLLFSGPADPGLLLAACAGALLPDLDSRHSIPGLLLPFVSRRLEARLGHLQEWHSLGAAVLVAVATLPLVLVISWTAWALVAVGFVSHLVLDLFSRQGVMGLWPFSRKRYSALPILDGPGGTSEQRLMAGLLLLAATLALLGDLGAPRSTPILAPSFDDTLNRYFSLRGRQLVFADIEGTWQPTGRRVYARFEILNAADRSYIMLDRYTGTVFTAGRSPNDNLYLNSISLAPGAAVRIKPVEVHLNGKRLVDALPVVYDMQREPGLQHIYVSGDVALPGREGQGAALLAPDYSQTHVRKIVMQEGDHVLLRYLTAAELINLSSVEVKTADLVIVATYAGGEGAPTATPLPSPAPSATVQP